jgi:glutathione peroxidase
MGDSMSAPIHEFTAERLAGGSQSLADYAGKVLLIVNTASQCGFTPQYAGLEALYQRYRERGLVVLGFPCNQFGAQEPGDAEKSPASAQKNYGVSFPMFAKIEVNGDHAHPLYQYLKKAAPGLLGSEANQVELHQVSGRSPGRSDRALCAGHHTGEHRARHRGTAVSRCRRLARGDARRQPLARPRLAPQRMHLADTTTGSGGRCLA